MSDHIALRVQTAYRCIELFKEHLAPEEWEQCVSGDDDPDSFTDSNGIVVDAFEGVFGYDPEDLFSTDRESEVLSHMNAAIRLATRLMLGETFTEAEAAEIVAEDDSHGLAIVGGGRNLRAVVEKYGWSR